MNKSTTKLNIAEIDQVKANIARLEALNDYKDKVETQAKGMIECLSRMVGGLRKLKEMTDKLNNIAKDIEAKGLKTQLTSLEFPQREGEGKVEEAVLQALHHLKGLIPTFYGLNVEDSLQANREYIINALDQLEQDIGKDVMDLFFTLHD